MAIRTEKVMIRRNKKLTVYADKLRKEMTPWERKLWFLFLKNYPQRFKRQYIIGNYIVDFVCINAGLIIELDGSGHYQEEQAKYDISRTDELQKRGFTVLRFANTEIDNNFSGVCLAIDKYVKDRINVEDGCAVATPPPAT